MLFKPSSESDLVLFEESSDCVIVSVDELVISQLGFDLVEPLKQCLKGFLELTGLQKSIFQRLLPTSHQKNNILTTSAYEERQEMPMRRQQVLTKRQVMYIKRYQMPTKRQQILMKRQQMLMKRL